MTGRPTVITPETQEGICEWLADGGNLISYCAQDGNPSHASIYRALEKDEGFREAYARAREVQAHADAENLNSLAEEARAGRLDPAAARVAADILKWTASKRLPKAYGDKVQLSNDSAAPLIITWANGDKV